MPYTICIVILALVWPFAKLMQGLCWFAGNVTGLLRHRRSPHSATELVDA